ncbi:hypothetical protein Q5P01_014641 [Channa striata]|uniref:Uncharacterized protein n=1 Tax=Channa striata TaxID=64152 RepID=A0AA88SN21_CHASR|nr:hypothetical protein Q5P01_014641 [Channa striata]
MCGSISLRVHITAANVVRFTGSSRDPVPTHAQHRQHEGGQRLEDGWTNPEPFLRRRLIAWLLCARWEVAVRQSVLPCRPVMYESDLWAGDLSTKGHRLCGSDRHNQSTVCARTRRYINPQDAPLVMPMNFG